MMAGCGGVWGQINSKGRGLMLQGSLPEQTAQREIQSPHHLPPPAVEVEPACMGHVEWLWHCGAELLTVTQKAPTWVKCSFCVTI